MTTAVITVRQFENLSEDSAYFARGFRDDVVTELTAALDEFEQAAAEGDITTLSPLSDVLVEGL